MNRETIVHVTTDGVRLTIEACGQRERVESRPRVEPWDSPNFRGAGRTTDERRLSYYSHGIFKRLCELGLTDEHLLRLDHRYRPVDVLWHHLLTGSLFGTHDFDDLRRLEACWGALERALEGEGSVNWDTAIEMALTEVPIREVCPWYGHGPRMAHLQKLAEQRDKEGDEDNEGDEDDEDDDGDEAGAPRRSVLWDLLGTLDE
jgi:hypothetical protein